MLQAIRDHAKGWIAYTIVGLLIIPFALWGINSYFDRSPPMNVAQVGSETISQDQFRQAYQQQQLYLRNLFGENAPLDLLEGVAIKNQVLKRLIDDSLLRQFALKNTLRISDAQVVKAIRNIEAFQRDQVFDGQLYQQRLSTQGYSPTAFEAHMRNALIAEQLQNGLTTSAWITPQELDDFVHLWLQQRQFQYIVLSLSSYRDKVQLDDTAIRDYFENHKARFLNPERVQLEYVELTVEKLAETITVSDDQLQLLYQEHRDEYTKPEERRVSSILLKVDTGATSATIDTVRAQAQSLHRLIVSGEKTFDVALEELKAANPDAVAGDEITVTPGIYEAALDEAVFALKAPNDITAPVQTQYGFHIVRLNAITPGYVKPFESVRDELAKKAQLREAENRFYDLVQTLTDAAYENPDNLQASATLLNLPILTTEWLTPQSREGLAAFPKVMEAAFSEEVLKRGLNSAPLEISPNHVVVVRVKAYEAATPRPLDDVRDEIVQSLRDEQARKILADDIQKMLEQAKQGTELAQLAVQWTAELRSSDWIGRNSDQLDRALLQEVFKLPAPTEQRPTFGTALLSSGDQVIIALLRIRAGSTEAMSDQERTAWQQRLANAVGTAQFQGFIDQLRERSKIVIHDQRL